MTAVDLSPELQQRMVALVRDYAALPIEACQRGAVFVDLHHRASVIVADPGFSAEVDEDEREVRNVLATCGWVNDDASYDAAAEVAREALRRGKQLAATQP
jgi:hypothetical protein